MDHDEGAVPEWLDALASEVSELAQRPQGRMMLRSAVDTWLADYSDKPLPHPIQTAEGRPVDDPNDRVEDLTMLAALHDCARQTADRIGPEIDGPLDARARGTWRYQMLVLGASRLTADCRRALGDRLASARTGF